MRRLGRIAVAPIAAAAPVPPPVRPIAVTGSRPRPRELLACGAGLALVTLLMCAVHVDRGGMYYDDWAVAALGRFPLSGGLLHGLWLSYGQRPGQVFYYAALDDALGSGAPLRLALAAAMVLAQATLLFALLRQLGLAPRHAGAIAALSLTFPFSDSVWLWGIMSLTSLAICAALLGLILALRAFRNEGWRALALHAASLALYVASILSYEVFAVAGLLAGLLYTRAASFRLARARWVVDVMAIALALAVARTQLPIDVATPSRTLSPAQMVPHVWLIAQRGVGLIGAAALPVGGASPWVGVGLLAAVLIGAVLLRARLRAGSAERAQLGSWLTIAGAGALVAAAAWAVYVPAPAHYAPSAAGTINRVNAAAAIGIAILLYASVVLLARLLTTLLRLPATAVGLVATVAAAALGAAYLSKTAADARAWDRAASDQRSVLADLRAALPRPPQGAVVFAFDAPRQVGPGIPVLDTTLDLTSAARISYESPSMLGVPITAATDLACSTSGPRADGVAGAYGKAYLIDVEARRAVRLTGPRQCVAQDRADL